MKYTKLNISLYHFRERRRKKNFIELYQLTSSLRFCSHRRFSFSSVFSLLSHTLLLGYTFFVRCEKEVIGEMENREGESSLRLWESTQKKGETKKKIMSSMDGWINLPRVLFELNRFNSDREKYILMYEKYFYFVSNMTWHNFFKPYCYCFWCCCLCFTKKNEEKLKMSGKRGVEMLESVKNDWSVVFFWVCVGITLKIWSVDIQLVHNSNYCFPC